jgi:hypothetical protein
VRTEETSNGAEGGVQRLTGTSVVGNLRHVPVAEAEQRSGNANKNGAVKNNRRPRGVPGAEGEVERPTWEK